MIVYLPPALLNLYWIKQQKRIRLFVFAITTTLLFAIPVEIISRLANAWDVLSIFPRIYGVAPLENLFYAFINFLWPLAFYEKFTDRDKQTKLSARFPILLLLYVSLFTATLFFMEVDKDLLALNYWAVGTLVLILPVTFIILRGSIKIKKIILTTLFFGLVFFIHESVSLIVGHWWWPGEYLLETQLFGHRFPIDDIIIWYILSTPALIMGYEYFVDDNK